METMSEFVATANHALKAAGKDAAAKRRFLRSLGVGAAMSYDQHHKYVDWYIVAPDVLSVSNLSVELLSG